ncbi:MAG: hypothetical protein Q8Q06_03435, partial [bacterium]|nr:hypothetical protein [bacterium]
MNIIEKEFRATFEPVTLADIMLAIDICGIEISGFANVEAIRNTFRIYGEAIILEQECSSGGTHLSELGRHKWELEMARSEKFKEIGRAKLWWHSHVFMPAEFSSIDTDTMRGFANSEDEFWLALVINKHREFKLWLNIYRPISRLFINIDNIEIEGNPTPREFKELLETRREIMREIIKDKVKKIEIFKGEIDDADP